MLPKEKADKCILLMNTQLSDDNGTDLVAVKEALCPDYKIEITKLNITKQTKLYIKRNNNSYYFFFLF